MNTQLPDSTVPAPAPPAEPDSLRELFAEAFLRPLTYRIRNDARIWMLPVIAACAWCRDERVFIAMPLILGALFVWLVHRDCARQSDT
jgi:hypothetical protein